MSDDSGGVLQRAWAILRHPHRTWAEIAEAPDSIRRIFMGHVLVFGAINPVCFTFGRAVFGERALGAVYRPPAVAAVIEGLISYLLVLGSVFVLAGLIEALAPPFDARKDRAAAFKVAAYSSTAGWVGSLFYLIPALGVLALLGQLYTLYLLYRGVEIVLRPPPRRTLGYVALIVVCYVVLMMLVISFTKLFAALV